MRSIDHFKCLTRNDARAIHLADPIGDATSLAASHKQPACRSTSHPPVNLTPVALAPPLLTGEQVLLMILVCGAELFTGNTAMLPAAVYKVKATVQQLLKVRAGVHVALQ